ncbi:hypothetical protein GGQ60_001306 [Pedobacter zeae]|uniref:Uncharacterized protein n=1 Tax=Pedobacter zeae TaxID=1737356 RepID=A0A7W6P5U4_9SPHI|nr:hypothetical protein [Pedobacter zeae]
MLLILFVHIIFTKKNIFYSPNAFSCFSGATNQYKTLITNNLTITKAQRLKNSIIDF